MPDEPLGMKDIAERLGVKVKDVHNWKQLGKLPAPDGYVSATPYWWAKTIDLWWNGHRSNNP